MTRIPIANHLRKLTRGIKPTKSSEEDLKRNATAYCAAFGISPPEFHAQFNRDAEIIGAMASRCDQYLKDFYQENGTLDGSDFPLKHCEFAALHRMRLALHYDDFRRLGIDFADAPKVKGCQSFIKCGHWWLSEIERLGLAEAQRKLFVSYML